MHYEKKKLLQNSTKIKPSSLTKCSSLNTGVQRYRCSQSAAVIKARESRTRFNGVVRHSNNKLQEDVFKQYQEKNSLYHHDQVQIGNHQQPHQQTHQQTQENCQNCFNNQLYSSFKNLYAVPFSNSSQRMNHRGLIFPENVIQMIANPNLQFCSSVNNFQLMWVLLLFVAFFAAKFDDWI